MTEATFEQLMEQYTVATPIEAWGTDDLVTLSLAIDAELQRRAYEEVQDQIAADYGEHEEMYGDDLHE